MLWAAFAGIFLVVLIAILWPLRFRPQAAPARRTYDMAVYKDQLLEVERDLENGIIGSDEAGAAKLEVSRKILRLKEADAAGKGADDSSAPGGRTILAVSITVFMAVIGFGAYAITGSPGLPGKPYAERISAGNTKASLDELVARVEDHLRKNPDDARGWTIIAPSYMKLGRYADAAKALEKVMKLDGVTASLMSGYGEALVMANQGIVNDQAKKVFEDAWRRDPTKPTAQYYLGLAEVQGGNKPAAVKRWQDMLNLAPATASWRPQIEAQIRKAGGKVPKAPLPITQLNKPAPAKPDAAHPGAKAGGGAPDIAAMVTGLAARLGKDGNDLNGWLMLARAYVVLNKRPEAAGALDRAEGIFKSDAAAMGKIAAARTTYGFAAQGAGASPQSSAKPGAKPGANPAPPMGEDGAPDISAMVSGLAARLEKKGDDLKGWIMLAQSYMVLKRKDDALKALDSAEARFKDKPDAMAQIRQARTRFGL